MQRYQDGHRISQIRFLDALLHPVCEVGRRRIVALRDELLGGPVGEQRLDFRTVLVQLGSLHKSDIIVRFARTNGELTSHLKAVPSVETTSVPKDFQRIELMN